MPGRVDIEVTPEGSWAATIDDDAGIPVARVLLPQALLKLIRDAQQARPGQALAWSFDLPVGRKVGRSLLRAHPVLMLRDVDAVSEED